MSTRYVAYYRVSTSGQGRSGLGLEAQRQAVHDFIGACPDHEFTEIESGKRVGLFVKVLSVTKHREPILLHALKPPLTLGTTRFSHADRCGG